MDQRTRQELHDLLSALLDGTLTPERQERLGDQLRQHPQARDLYLAYMALHANLALRGDLGDLALPLTGTAKLAREIAPAAATSGASEDPPHHPRRTRRLVWAALGLASLAAGLFLALALWPRPPVISHPKDLLAEPTDQTVAVLSQAPGAEWEETGLPTRVGALLSVGRLRLRSGFAQIQFYSGATVILEAPAEFHLISRTDAYCARGKLRATVPPHAQGFTIGTPKLELVDRGTEFGLDVGAEGRTEVHVFQGKVEVYDAHTQRDAATRRELATGQGVRLDSRDGVRLIPSAPAAFRTARDVAARSEEEARRRHDAWLAAGKALSQDPSLLVQYPFQAQQSWSQVLRAQAGDQQQHDGTIVGCAWVPGRWPGKRGLEFKQVSDRVRLHVPGTFASITLVAWVRVDALPNVNNSLFMTDGWEVGGLHWQIGEAGKLVLGVKAPPGTPNGHYHAFGVFTPERFGQWVQLAVVYDQDRRQVTHFVDGRPVGSTGTEFDVPLCIGNAEIGNWNIASYANRQPIRNLNGCMDEFLLFSRALTKEDIQKLYAQGKPGVIASSLPEGNVLNHGVSR
jgi:hypothetical protein